MTASELVFVNARIVTRDEVVSGSLRLEDGLIADLDSGPSTVAGAVDCQGDYLLPGLVELHTDNLEQHFTPRPGVKWHGAAATMAHDAEMAAAGITTVYDALSLGDAMEGSARQANLMTMVDSLRRTVAAGWLRADHRLHLRCEVSSPSILDVFAALVDDPLVGVVSLTDHAPGQRQFVRLDKYREYYMGKYQFDEPAMEAFIATQLARAERYSDRHRQTLAEQCRARSLVLASHDDATLEHVAESAALGMQFAEFPTTAEAAAATNAAGMKVMMGAPNLVRGGSHSGNVSAAELARSGHLDILSSDYVPSSLMFSAFMLQRGDFGIALPDAIATVSATPAEIVGLHDRGRIAVGRRGDLVRVLDTGEVPVVRGVWSGGRQVA